MFDGDLACRAIHYPKFLGSTGVLDPEALLKFDNLQGTSNYAMSVASKFLCRKEAAVHAYGERAAESKNERFRRQTQREPQPLSEEVHYLGYYEFTAGALRGIPMEYYRLRLVWKPEDGEDVHFQAEMTEGRNSATKALRRNDRRAAIGLLYARLSGPKRYICAKDEIHRAELEAIDLPHCGHNTP